MAARTVYEQQHRYPAIGLLALAVTLTVYVLNQIEVCRPSALAVGSVLVAGGCVQLFPVSAVISRVALTLLRRCCRWEFFGSRWSVTISSPSLVWGATPTP